MENPTKEEMLKVFAKLANYVAQSEAAMLAVIAAHKREELENSVGESAKVEIEMWDILEGEMVKSIHGNDGKVVYWIGQAAKQINPLLS